MDSEFMARYLREPQQGAELEPGRRGDVEPVAEPQPPAPSAIEEPGPPVGAAETDERTNVLPERESGAALPPGANEPGHPGPANQPAAPWERPPRAAAAGRPAAARGHAARRRRASASPSQGAASNHQERPRPGPGELRATTAAPEDRPRRTLSPERTPATPATSPWGHSPDAEHAPQWQAGQHLRVDELVKSRKLPPEMGWRKTVYTLTGHLVNLGPGPAERRLRDQIAAIGTDIAGQLPDRDRFGHRRDRQDPHQRGHRHRVCAVSHRTGGGDRCQPHLRQSGPADRSARHRVDPRVYGGHPNGGLSQGGRYTGKNPKGLEVLAGNQNMANPLALSAKLFTDTSRAPSGFISWR